MVVTTGKALVDHHVSSKRASPSAEAEHTAERLISGLVDSSLSWTGLPVPIPNCSLAGQRITPWS